MMKTTSAEWIGRRVAFGALLAGLVLSPARLQPQNAKASEREGNAAHRRRQAGFQRRL